MKNKLVSILIPVYNRESLIEETVKSALSQTYTNIEVIVVDNKSTDSTWEILNNLATYDSRIKIFQNERNLGPVRNWKRCIDEASGEYGKILWSDDLIAPEFLEETLPFVYEKDVAFVFTGTEIFDSTSRKISTYFIGETQKYSVDRYINGVLVDEILPVSPGCALFRTDDLKANLLLNIPNNISCDFSMQAIGNDLLIFLLTAKDYDYFAFVNKKLSFFRGHPGSISAIEKDKLTLFYALSKAFFLEEYHPRKIVYYNTFLYIILMKYSNNKYGLNDIKSFYMKNTNFEISYVYFVKIIFSKLYLKLKLRIKKLCLNI